MTQKTRHKIQVFFVLLLTCALYLVSCLSGCGYTTSSNLSGRYKKIYIKPFENKVQYSVEGERSVYLPQLETDITNEVISQFLFNGRLKVSKENEADLILSGELLEFSRGGLRFSDDDDVQEYRIVITVALKLWDATKAQEKWVESSFSGETTYFVTGPDAVSEDTAIKEALKDLAQRIVERTVDDW